MTGFSIFRYLFGKETDEELTAVFLPHLWFKPISVQLRQGPSAQGWAAMGVLNPWMGWAWRSWMRLVKASKAY